MKYRIVMEGEDLKEDVEGFVADVEDHGTVETGDEGYCIVVDTIELIVR